MFIIRPYRQRLMLLLKELRETQDADVSYQALSPYGETLSSEIKGCHSAFPQPPSVLCPLTPVRWTFTFSAKEKDFETGLSYFGSRYYSSDLSIWLSVDPMSDKYPSLSPYVYCADNPIKLVDPEGEEIIVPDDRPFGRSSFEQPPTQSLSLSNNSPKIDFKGGYGFSLDLNLTFIMGFSMEVGFVADGSGNGSMFFSRGWSTGVEASIGLNGFYIPNCDFNIDCFKGKSESLSISFKKGLGVSLFSDYSAGAMKDYLLNDYGGLKVGLGYGLGASLTHSKTTFFQMPRRDNSGLPVYYQAGHM